MVEVSADGCSASANERKMIRMRRVEAGIERSDDVGNESDVGNGRLTR